VVVLRVKRGVFLVLVKLGGLGLDGVWGCWLYWAGDYLWGYWGVGYLVEDSCLGLVDHVLFGLVRVVVAP
jgi:hypothetical protein